MPMLTMFRIPFAFKALAMLKKRLSNLDDPIKLVIDEQTLAWDFYSERRIQEHWKPRALTNGMLFHR